MRGEGLGQFGGERGAAGELGERGGEAAARGAGRRCPRVQISGSESASSAARVLAGLLYVAMAGPQRSAMWSRRSATLLEGRRRGGEQADAVEEREQRGEQRPQAPGADAGVRSSSCLVRGGGHRYDEAVRAVDRLGERGAGGGDGDDGAAAAVGLLGEEGEAGFGAVGGGDQEQVHGARPAGQCPAQGARGGGDAGGGEAGDGAAGAGERAEEVGDAGGGGAGARDEDGAGAAVGLEVGDAGLGGVPGGGADAGAGLGGAAEQAAAVGLARGPRGCRAAIRRAWWRQPPIAGAPGVAERVRRGRAPVALVGRGGGRAEWLAHAGRRASSTRRTGMPSRTG